MQEVTLIINGQPRHLLVEPHETLLFTIRERVGLTGTKAGCDQGSCGACTLIVEDTPVLSCITPVVRCSGRKIRTIEDVAQNGKLHPVQEQLVQSGGIQCGYCTPGMVMTALAFLERNPDPTDSEIREAISGNLCRCTGYAKIVTAIRDAAQRLQQ